MQFGRLGNPLTPALVPQWGRGRNIRRRSIEDVFDYGTNFEIEVKGTEGREAGSRRTLDVCYK